MTESSSGTIPTPTSGAAAGRNVLIIEDEMIIAYCLADQLEDLQFSVHGIEASGEEALKSAAASKPDLAIVDVGLRGKLDGVDTAIELRRRFDVPSILASGAGGKVLTERAKEANPIAILTKPFTLEDLQAALTGFVGSARV